MFNYLFIIIYNNTFYFKTNLHSILLIKLKCRPICFYYYNNSLSTYFAYINAKINSLCIIK